MIWVDERDVAYVCNCGVGALQLKAFGCVHCQAELLGVRSKLLVKLAL